jgi:metal-responsive CopG/Arc/MetJ family transcriptional regulator
MTTHPYWGSVDQDWAGFSSDISFSHPFFTEQNITIFLGEEFDDEGEEIEDLPTENQLNAFAKTYQDFLANIETKLSNIQSKAFAYYQKHYAHYFENPEKSGEAALGIDTVEKHNDYIKELMELRVLADHTIKVSIRYHVDTEHGIEFKMVGGQVEKVGGIAET